MSRRRYRLTNAAAQDLLKIARYGDENFGKAQSDKYRNKLKARIELIAENPLMYPTVNYIRQGYRRSVCGAHSIYYKIDSEIVTIVRILKKENAQKVLDT